MGYQILSFQLLINQQGIEKLNYNDLSDSLHLFNATQMYDIIPEFEFPTLSHRKMAAMLLHS